MDHFCGALSNRLGITDVCHATAALGVLANNIPADGYSRGAESPVLNSDPSLFFRFRRGEPLPRQWPTGWSTWPAAGTRAR